MDVLPTQAWDAQQGDQSDEHVWRTEEKKEASEKEANASSETPAEQRNSEQLDSGSRQETALQNSPGTQTFVLRSRTVNLFLRAT